MSTFTGGGSVALSNSSGINNLISRLESFKNNQFNIAGQEATIEASKKATIDIAKRKQQVAKIRETVKDLSEQQRQIGSLLTGKTKGDVTIYGRAYDTAAKAAYSNQVTVDAKSAADIATVEAKGDPKAFNNMYSNFERQTIESAPSPETQTVARRAFLQYGSTAYKSIAIAKQKEQDTLNKKSFEETLGQISSDYIDATVQGDEVTKHTIILKAQALRADAVKNGWYSESMFQSYYQKMEKEANIALAKSGLVQAMNSGVSSDYINLIYKNKDLRKSLKPEEMDKLASDMISTVSTFHKMNAEKEKEANRIEAEHNKEIKKSLKENQVNGTLTQDMVEHAFKANALTLPEYKSWLGDITNAGPIVPDMEQEMQVRVNPSAYDTEDITNMATLTYKQRIDLLAFKTKFENSPETKWTTSIEGKEGVRRIRDNWKELQVSLPGMPIDKRTIAAYNKTMTTYMNEMLKLPMDQREAHAIPLADSILEVYKEKVMQTKIEKQSKDSIERNQKKKEGIIQEAEAYRNSLSPTDRGYYDKGVAEFRTTFGVSGDLNFGGENGNN